MAANQSPPKDVTAKPPLALGIAIIVFLFACFVALAYSGLMSPAKVTGDASSEWCKSQATAPYRGAASDADLQRYIHECRGR